MGSGSISFDRAAAYYDRTRTLSDGALGTLIPIVAGELSSAGRVLEIGVGTGRIALPLVRNGVNLVGVDISREMLGRLRENAAGSPPPLAIADATRLPFGDGEFGGAVAAHVFHLIPAWKDAVSEVIRVVRPGGVLIASRGGRTQAADWWKDVRREFFRAAGDPPWPPGMDRIEELDAEIAVRGGEVRRLPEVAEPYTASVADLLAMLEAGVWSACWSIEPDARVRAAAAAREWAVENVGRLDEARPVTEVLAWRSYRLP